MVMVSGGKGEGRGGEGSVKTWKRKIKKKEECTPGRPK